MYMTLLIMLMCDRATVMDIALRDLRFMCDLGSDVVCYFKY